MRFCIVLLLASAASAVADPWLARSAPALTSEEKKRYLELRSENEREAFRRWFWSGKSVTEQEYLERVAFADTAFGSGRDGSGANTDQGRMYIAGGKPDAIHRMPSSRIFVECEIWYYESLPRTGYSSRLQFLFYRRGGYGDFKLYSPQLGSIRDLLIPQPGTRLMFPVNDIVTANDIRGRLKYSPAEEEVVDAATGVARGVTGAEADRILSCAASIAHMLRRDAPLRPVVESRFTPLDAPQVSVVQFTANDIPVVDISARSTAAGSIGLTVEDRSGVVERSAVPLGLSSARPVLYTQRFFLAPGRYRVIVESDGRKVVYPFAVAAGVDGIVGEEFEPRDGELRIAILPDPRSEDARRTWVERSARSAAARQTVSPQAVR